MFINQSVIGPIILPAGCKTFLPPAFFHNNLIHFFVFNFSSFVLYLVVANSFDAFLVHIPRV